MQPLRLTAKVLFAVVTTMLFGILTVSKAQAELHVIHGEFFHFGTVGPEIVERKIELVNVGTLPVDVAEVKSSCSCTLAPIDREHLQPGDTATLNVQLDLRRKTGEVEQRVTVTSTNGEEVVVTLAAEVVRALIVEPLSFPTLFGIPAFSEVSTVVTLYNQHTTNITLYPPHSTFEGDVNIAFNIEKAVVVKPGEAFDLTVYLMPVEAGIKTGMVKIPTSSEINPMLSVMLTYGATMPKNSTTEDVGINNISSGEK